LHPEISILPSISSLPLYLVGSADNGNDARIV
jgi:hypothetical protein